MVCPDFAVALLYLRLFSSAPIDALRSLDGSGLSRDRRFVAAPVAQLTNVKTIIPPKLSLRPTEDDRHLAQAEAAYAALDAQHPAHAYQAQVLDAEQLQEAIDAGLMFDVRVGQEWAGYAGVHPDEHLGLPSYSVQELLLSPAFRGRGYGAHLTTLLARSVLEKRPSEPGRALFGAIYADNAGAYSAALRAGRADVGGWVQLEL